MQFFTCIAFVYYLTDTKSMETRKLYSATNTIFVFVAISCLILDFCLKLFALDSFYCQNLVPEDFMRCKEGLQGAYWWHFVCLFIIVNVYVYAAAVLRKFSETYLKDDFINASESVL